MHFRINSCRARKLHQAAQARELDTFHDLTEESCYDTSSAVGITRPGNNVLFKIQKSRKKDHLDCSDGRSLAMSCTQGCAS